MLKKLSIMEDDECKRFEEYPPTAALIGRVFMDANPLARGRHVTHLRTVICYELWRTSKRQTLEGQPQ
jgi:hypothetical protein